MDPTGQIDCDDESDEDSQMCKDVWTCTEGFILIEGKMGKRKKSALNFHFVCKEMSFLETHKSNMFE